MPPSSSLPPSASAISHTSPSPPSTSRSSTGTDSIPPSSTPRPQSTPTESKSASPSSRQSQTPSPPRPPVSPLTPTAKLASLAPLITNPNPTTLSTERASDTESSLLGRCSRPTPPDVEWITQPTPMAVDESENPDAIAVKAAISVLQIQRAKAQKDIQSLARIRDRAVDDPVEFAQAMQQRARSGRGEESLLDPTLDDWKDEESTTGDDVAMTGAEEYGESPVDSNLPARPGSDATFSELPRPQNVVRCPAINWGKYGIVGTTFDKMHAEQLARPTLNEPIMLTPFDPSSPNVSTSHASQSGASHRSSLATPGAVGPFHPDEGNSPLPSSGHDFSKGTHPLLKQQFDYFGRAPAHVLAGPVDPMETAEQERVGMKVGGWGNLPPSALHGAHPNGRSVGKDGRKPAKKGN